jgi:hypothetical protein
MIQDSFVLPGAASINHIIYLGLLQFENIGKEITLAADFSNGAITVGSPGCVKEIRQVTPHNALGIS